VSKNNNGNKYYRLKFSSFEDGHGYIPVNNVRFFNDIEIVDIKLSN